MGRLFLLIALLSTVWGCSSERPADVGTQGQRPDVGMSAPEKTLSQPSSVTADGYSLNVFPPEPTRTATLHAAAQGFNLSEAKIEWLVNGTAVVSPVAGQLRLPEMKKGDTVQAKATVSGMEILSSAVKIKNSPPVIDKVTFVRVSTPSGETLGIEVTTSDADEDTVAVSYEWTKNGEPAGNAKHISPPLRRGDRISVKVIPFDGEDYGRAAVFQKDVRNTPPVITQDKTHGFDGRVYTYQVRATDADGDTLSYTLKKGPQGMTINSSTGFVRWEVPAGFTGRAPATVAVTDGHGGEASYDFDVIIGPGKKD